MSSSSERNNRTRRSSIVRNILITLLIALPSGGADLGSPGHEILGQRPVRIILTSTSLRKTRTQDQMNQLATQSQLASLSEIRGNRGAGRPFVTESNDMVVRELRQRHLILPLSDLRTENLRDSFNDSRGHGIHQAIDILAPRSTPILAVQEGSIARLWYSVPGGITIYQFDPGKEYEYYYAHLESYARGLKEGDQVQRGQVIGYVGTTGNAPKGTPHLHFTIFKLKMSQKWWEGTAVNPYLVFR